MAATMDADMDRFIAATVLRIVLHRNLVKSKEQIQILKMKLKGLIWRHNRARALGLRHHERSLAIQIDVTEGMRSMVYEYARDVADKLSDLYWKMHEIIVVFSIDYDHLDNERPDEDDDDDIDAELETLMEDFRI